MRILLVSHKFPPHALGGVEVYTHNLAQALLARHQVSVFYRHDDPPGRGVVSDPPFVELDEHVGGVQTRRVSCRPQGIGASVVGQFWGTFLNRQIEAGFARYLRQVQPDLIHIQHVMALSAQLLQLARQSGAPVVLTLHDYWFICGNSQLIWPDAQVCRGKAWGMNCVRCAAAARFPSPAVRLLRPGLAPLFLYRDRVTRQAALQAQVLISPSRFLIEQYTQAGFPRDRFVHLENAVPVGRIRRIPWRPRAGPLRVTYLGALAWQKGVHLLAEAFEGLPPAGARLQIWGNPAAFPDYAGRVRALLADPDAQFKGTIANERVGEVLADSDVVVVPSLWYENSPVVIQEARAAGVPVIASGHGAMAEKVRHEVDGLLFTPGSAAALRQAIQRLIDDPDLLARLRQSPQPPMDLPDHVQQLEAVYDRVLAGKGDPSWSPKGQAS
jgi:glycosyltransferase involved in cell wall biosynthesis